MNLHFADRKYWACIFWVTRASDAGDVEGPASLLQSIELWPAAASSELVVPPQPES